ncbi:MAG: hypothetical protein P4L99_04530 [Chthoniobacter sp.]|nr:hypothetical protein [Chthoniobacter sp.]
MTGSGTSLIAWWGASLSTLLALIKLWEIWRQRFRVEISYNFTSETDIGNKVLIRNLTGSPIILTHWELLYSSGYWPFRRFEPLESSEHDSGDCRIDAHATRVLSFSEANYFDTGPTSLKGRAIVIRLHIAGRRPVLCQVYEA